MNLLCILISSILVSSFCPAEEPLRLTFDQIKTMDFTHQEVVIRGFLYISKGKQWVLAAEPDLKTCCIGSIAKVDQQVFVYGSHLPCEAKQRPVTLAGTLIIDPTYSEKGELRQLFKLKDARMIKEHGGHLPYFTILACVAILSMVFLIRKRHG